MSHRKGVLSIEDIAAGIGVARSTVHLWVKKGCPRGPLDEVAAWREQNIALSDPDKEEINEAIKLAELAKLEEEGRYRSIKNDQLEGKLIDRDDVARDLRFAFNILRNELKSLGASVAIHVHDGEKGVVKQKVEQTLRKAFERAADALREHSLGDHSGFDRLPGGSDDGGMDD